MTFGLNAAVSRQRKLDGQQLALGFDGGEWKYLAEREFVSWLTHCREAGLSEVTMEQFRAQCLLPDPHSLNCWGAFTRSMCLAGRIRDSGKRLRAESITAHSREIKVWRIVTPIHSHSQEAIAS